MLAVCLRLLIRMWLVTLRIRRVGPPFIRPCVVAFLHGDQLPLLAIRPARPAVAPVSLSRDGTLQTRILSGLGIDAVRGSSSRGGARALLGLVRALKSGAIALLAVDGPRGPRGEAKAGVGFLAQRSQVAVYPASVAVRHGHRLRRAWDRYLLPMPFTRTHIEIGEPLRLGPGETPEEFAARLTLALTDARARAIRATHGSDRGDGGDRPH